MLGIVFAVSANFVFSVSNVLFKKTEKDTSPTMINLFRTLVGVVTFLIVAIITNTLHFITEIPSYLIVQLILSSVLGQVLGDSAYFFSQHYLGPAKALAVSLTYPFFTIIIDILFFNGDFNPWIILGAIIISAGVLLIAYSQRSKIAQEQNSDQNPKRQILLGILFAFIASISWAVGIIYTDLSMTELNFLFNTGRLTSIVGTMVRFPVAAILLGGINFSIYGVYRHKERLHPNKSELQSSLYQIRGRSTSSWLWLTAGALIGTSLGVYLFTEATYLAGAVTMSMMTPIGPVFSVLLDRVINKEKISILGLLGIFFTIGGVILILLL